MLHSALSRTQKHLMQKMNLERAALIVSRLLLTPPMTLTGIVISAEIEVSSSMLHNLYNIKVFFFSVSILVSSA